MAKWDIDKQILTLEPPYSPGTMISRVLLDVSLFARYNLKVPVESKEKREVPVWCLSVGLCERPKAFFYSLTIRGAFLKARKAVKDGTLAKHNPWGEEPYPFEKPKRRPKKKMPKAKKAKS
jgi:hypothetical protein